MTSWICHKASTRIALLDLAATLLLDKFGEGGHKPGYGSAAALMGILSAKLIITVCKLSLTKRKYRHGKQQAFDFVIDQIQNQIEVELRHLFQRDAEVFAAVIKARSKRDGDVLEQAKEYRREELERLREATEIPLKIGRLCLRLIDHAVFTFDSGFQSARGNSGASVSTAIAGVSSAAFVMNIN